ncbi:MAG: hypothetical protein QM641_12380, partial [Microbacterium sp.]
MSRRALVVTIPNPGGIENDEYPSLADFAHHASEVGAALRELEYDEVNGPDGTAEWDAERLDAEVRSLIREKDPDGVRLVHILGHGKAEVGSLRVVGADGETDAQCDVVSWLSAIQSDPDAPPRHPLTLFILDTCHSGAAADPSWGGDVFTEGLRGWVLAASAKEKSAYNGRLSKAVAETLKQIAQNTFGMDTQVRWVPWPLFRDRVRDVVERDQGEVHRQRVTATRTDRDIELAFIPNPGYVAPGAIDKARSIASPGLAEFLDAEHFAARAGGHPGRASTDEYGSFAGRASQLHALTKWIERADARDSVRVVTGSPGAGKSALIGILVCAAHPELRDATKKIWNRAATCPRKQKAIAAVHVRAMTVSQVLMAIAQQLDLRPATVQGTSAADWTESSLVEALSTLPAPPLVVIDAVDESADVAGVVGLLAALASRTADGGVISRLLVGTRSGSLWPKIDRWVSTLGDGLVVSLDDVGIDQMRNDLEAYFRSELPDEAFDVGSRLADVLVGAHDDHAEWGLFLVATLLAQSLARRVRFYEPITEDDVVAQIPTSLPGILDIDLETSEHPSLARALLTCLAWGKGDGMPLSVIELLMNGLFHPHASVTSAELLALLDNLRFYLRRGADEHGQTLYRLFHQSLIDYLRTDAATLAYRLLDVLLEDRPVIEGRRCWASADPYLKQHILSHAIDALCAVQLIEDDTELLVHAEPESALDAIRHVARDGGRANALSGTALTDKVRALIAIYRTTSLRGLTAQERRDVLAMNAARFGLPHLTQEFVGHPDSASAWSPAWATGEHVRGAAVEAPLTGHRGRVCAVACTSLGDLPIAVTGGYDGTVRIWDLSTGTQLGDPLPGHTGSVTSVACSTVGDDPVAVTCGTDGMLRIWDLGTGTQLGDSLPGHIGGVDAVACTSLAGRPVAVAAGDHSTLRIWDLATGTQIGGPFTGHIGGVDAVACTAVNGLPVAVTGGHDGTVRLWDLSTGAAVAGPFTGHVGAVTAVASAAL